MTFKGRSNFYTVLTSAAGECRSAQIMATLTSTNRQTPDAGNAVNPSWADYLRAGGACATTAGIAWPLVEWMDPANIVMLFLLPVVYAAFRLGRGPAAFAAVLSVALFDFLFVPPQWSFAVADIQYLLTFAVMLVVGLTIAHLSSVMRLRAEEAARRERQTRALYELAHQLAGALNLRQVDESLQRFAADVLGAPAILLVTSSDRSLSPAVTDSNNLPAWLDMRLALMARDSGRSTDLDATPCVAYVPLRATHDTRGVLATLIDCHAAETETHSALLDAIGALLATAVERLHFVDVAAATQLAVEAERLRISILSALSHDMRTPLTAMVGMADTLASGHGDTSAPTRELATRIRDQGRRISDMITNLLEMARLQTGSVKLRLEWQPVAEIIGSSITLLRAALDSHPVRVDIPRGFPLLRFDALLMERVICNLLENSCKYAPAGTPIDIVTRVSNGNAELLVRDRGPGLPRDRDVFALFVRGPHESAKTGVGLGLAICRAIVEAHEGRIWAEHASDDEGGTLITISLPLGNPPAIINDEGADL